MARKKTKRSKSTTLSSKKKGKLGLAIVALILNILILPGLGSLIAGKTQAGIWQLVLAILGFVLSFILIGIPLLIVAYIWGIVTGVRLIQEAS